MIISHEHYRYQRRRENAGANKYNGAYYYSREIVKNIIPRVETGRNWITVNLPEAGCDHAIVFVHNNLNAERYDWLKRYDDLVLVCGIPETCEKVAHLGQAIYLPLSIDTEYVKQFGAEKTKGVAYAGRRNKRDYGNLPIGIDYLSNMPRDTLLRRMAQYEYVYAVGRTAIEARALGCTILPYDKRFPDPSIWQVVDNREAAAMLQVELDRIDR